MLPSSRPLSLSDSTPVPVLRHQQAASPRKTHLNNLWVRAQAGDPDAFTLLYRQHNRRVFAICIRMVHDFSLAEDLTQETFLQLHRKIASFRGESLFTTWLHRMTVNVVLMHLRKRVLPTVSLDEMVLNIPEGHNGYLSSIDLSQTGVADRIAIERAVDMLAPGYRRFFLLHDVYGLEHRELASVQGCSVGNSKSKLHKARCALRGTLATHGELRCPPQGDTRAA